MPAGIMLQVEVDDADAVAEQARSQGLNPQGPMLAHGERIYRTSTHPRVLGNGQGVLCSCYDRWFDDGASFCPAQQPAVGGGVLIQIRP